MNELLSNQIKKYLFDLSTDERERFSDFFSAIESSYNDSEADRMILKQSLEDSSSKMLKNNKTLHYETEASTQAIENLKLAVNSLAPQSYARDVEHDNSGQEIVRLTEFLSRLILEHKQNIVELRRQMQTAEDLAQELQHFKLAVDGAADFISIFDADYRLLHLNNAIHLQTGYSLETSRGKGIRDLWWKGMDQSQYESILAQLVESRKAIQIEVAINKSYTSAPIPVRAFLTPLFGDNGDLAYIVNIGHDITEEIELEQKKNEFVSIASHELRTPMTVIRNYAVILREGKFGQLSEKQLHYVERIVSNSTRLIELVGNMLNISKLEANKFSFEPLQLIINSLIEEQVEDFSEVYNNKNVSLTIKSNDEIEAYADPEQTKQVLTNLLSNALKFTPSGGRVTIWAQKDQIDADMMQVSIEDSGVGISDQGKKALFTKFSQIDNVIQRQTYGTGLGLVICKDIVERMGGTIGVESTFGAGSKFYFTLPRAGPKK
jgi:PAS domain S-box-containing protein